MANPSPLRYPGGKHKLSSFVSLVIGNLGLTNCTYIEPFAGGAGVALALLFEGRVNSIVINDYDKAIYSFWRAVKQEPKALIKRIESIPVTIEEWHKQKYIYCNSKAYSLDLAVATLFLNRTNRSGILNAGPIGGYSQSGDWHLDVRFNKQIIIDKIKKISEYRNNISVYNKDIISILKKYSKNTDNNLFFYFDPPYYNKGQKLYKNYFNHNDHVRIHDVITNEISAPWILTYDDVQPIIELYSKYQMRRFDLTYSVANKGIASELVFFQMRMVVPHRINWKKIRLE